MESVLAQWIEGLVRRWTNYPDKPEAVKWFAKEEAARLVKQMKALGEVMIVAATE